MRRHTFLDRQQLSLGASICGARIPPELEATGAILLPNDIPDPSMLPVQSPFHLQDQPAAPRQEEDGLVFLALPPIFNTHLQEFTKDQTKPRIL